ncbi:hypothetical protein HN51_031048 [Arachis hypogaea]
MFWNRDLLLLRCHNVTSPSLFAAPAPLSPSSIVALLHICAFSSKCFSLQCSSACARMARPGGGGGEGVEEMIMQNEGRRGEPCLVLTSDLKPRLR